MSNTGFSGINVKQTTGNILVFDTLIQDYNSNLVTTGTTSLYLYELRSNGSLWTYDFTNLVFTSGAVTSETLAMSHQTTNNGTTNTGIWTAVVSGASAFAAFTQNAIYYARTRNTSGTPTDQVTKFQFGGFEGDTTLTSIASAVHNLSLESGWTHAQTMRVILSAVAGAAVVSGNIVIYRDVNDTKNRIEAETNSGERTNIVYDGN